MDSSPRESLRFYVLSQEDVGSRYEVYVEDVEPANRGEGSNCSSCGKPVGMFPWFPPYRAKLEVYGEELGDFIKVIGDEFFISEHFLAAFRAEGLTGLQGFHPVEIVRTRRMKKGPKISKVPRYAAVTVCDSRMAVNLKCSRVRYTELPTCDECREGHKDAIYGFSLEEGLWQGEDIFRPRGLNGLLVVSERFKRFVERHELTNILLAHTEEYVWNPLGLDPLPVMGSTVA